MNISPVIKENIRSLFLDFSLPSVIALVLLLNFYIAINNKIFTEPPTPFPFWFMYFFDDIALILYAGYIGTKFFAREFDKNTMITLIVTPLGKKGVYTGKLLAGISTIGLISLIVFLQIIFFFMVWGPVSYLFLYWYGAFTIILFISMLFSFFLTIIVGSLIKKTGLTLLLVSLYAIFSFFVVAFMPINDYVIDNRIAYVLLFPGLGLWYMHLSISYYAVIYPISMLIGALSTSVMGITSYWVFQGVKV